MLDVNNYKDFVFAIFTIVYLHVGVRYCLYFCTLVKSKQQTQYDQTLNEECSQLVLHHKSEI